MADGKPGQEPSMEEILTSIRRIIAEDEGGDLPAGPGRAAPAEPDMGVLELTEIVSEGRPPARPAPPQAAPPQAAHPQTPHPQAMPPTPMAPPPAQPATHQPAAAPAPQAQPAAAQRPQPAAARPAETAPALISDETARASAAALARLTRPSAPEAPRPAAASGQATVEQFLESLLKPMLREWLDHNLPAIVERAVEQEVKKLARRAELM